MSNFRTARSRELQTQVLHPARSESPGRGSCLYASTFASQVLPTHQWSHRALVRPPCSMRMDVKGNDILNSPGRLSSNHLQRSANTAGCLLVTLQRSTRPRSSHIAPNVSERTCAASPGTRWLLKCHLRNIFRMCSSLTTGTLNLSIAKLLAALRFRGLFAICAFVLYLSKKQLRVRSLCARASQR